MKIPFLTEGVKGVAEGAKHIRAGRVAQGAWKASSGLVDLSMPPLIYKAIKDAKVKPRSTCSVPGPGVPTCAEKVGFLKQSQLTKQALVGSALVGLGKGVVGAGKYMVKHPALPIGVGAGVAGLAGVNAVRKAYNQKQTYGATNV